jgi:hypothetical protein
MWFCLQSRHISRSFSYLKHTSQVSSCHPEVLRIPLRCFIKNLLNMADFLAMISPPLRGKVPKTLQLLQRYLQEKLPEEGLSDCFEVVSGMIDQAVNTLPKE